MGKKLTREQAEQMLHGDFGELIEALRALPKGLDAELGAAGVLRFLDGGNWYKKTPGEQFFCPLRPA